MTRNKNRKKFIGLAICLAALVAIVAMSYAWFTDTLSPLKVDVTAAKIKVTALDNNEWKIGGDKNLLANALPGETVEYGSFRVKNESNRKAVARVRYRIEGTLKIGNQNASQNPNHRPLAEVWSDVKNELDAYLAGSISIGNATTRNLFPPNFASLPTTEQDAIIGAYKADIKQCFQKDTLTVNLKLYDFLMDNASQLASKGVWAGNNTRAKIIYGVTHFYEILKNIEEQVFVNKWNALTTAPGSPFITYVKNSGNYYGEVFLALGVPTGPSDDTIDFGTLKFKIPNTLGGDLVDTSKEDVGTQVRPTPADAPEDRNKRSYNWGAQYFNEQEATINFALEVKVVQGTKDAVADVFGDEVANSPQIGPFLTSN